MSAISSAEPEDELMFDSLPPLKTVLFDMGNVLVFFCHERMCRQIGEVCGGRSADEIRGVLLDSGLQWDFERGFISEEVFRQRLEQALRCQIDAARLQLAAADIFELNASLLPVLDALKRQGLRLMLLSNTCITHVNFIRAKYDFLDRFDHLVVSYEAGAIKPEDGIYRAALAAINCEPAECLYLDDIPAYVEKGRTFGLQAEVFTTTEALLPQLARRNVQWDLREV